jgi:hypothetical protein
MQQCTSQFANKEGHIEHIEEFHKKNKFRLNSEEFFISQLFYKDFKPSKLNNEGQEVTDKHFWEERICYIYEDCHYPKDGIETNHLKILLKGTEFEPTKFQLVILEGMNPIWKYLIIAKF